jgi:hypothetical protein
MSCKGAAVGTEAYGERTQKTPDFDGDRPRRALESAGLGNGLSQGNAGAGSKGVFLDISKKFAKMLDTFRMIVYNHTSKQFKGNEKGGLGLR